MKSIIGLVYVSSPYAPKVAGWEGSRGGFAATLVCTNGADAKGLPSTSGDVYAKVIELELKLSRGSIIETTRVYLYLLRPHA